jgi:peptide/nickel transport system permease protein
MTTASSGNSTEQLPVPNKTATFTDEFAVREIGWWEKTLGPETYRILKGIVTNPLSIIGTTLIVLFFATGLLAPLLAPPKPNTRDPYMIPRDGYSPTPREPGSVWKSNPPPMPGWLKVLGYEKWIHVMGTAGGQWDIFYGIVWGTRTALKVGLIIEGLTLVVGILVGSLAAFYGGWVDDVLMRITEIFMAFPSLLAALTLAAVLTPVIGKGLTAPLIALVAFGWMSYARIIRGDILSVRERDYIMAARVIGVKDRRIITRHIVPNAIYPTLILASLNIGADVVSFAALSFLGIGTEVGYADWGQLIAFARNWIPSLYKYWFIVVFPAMALILFTLGWNLVGDALRDIMDPRMRGRGA